MLATYASFVTLIFLTATTPSIAQTATEKARLARTIWSAFQCVAYAEMSGDAKEQKRLFTVGLKAGREFLDALKKRQIPPDIAIKEVPLGVNVLLAGPNADLIIGRVFENAMQDAFDNIVKRDAYGVMEFDPTKWLDNKVLKKAKARTKYLQGNCVLLK